MLVSRLTLNNDTFPLMYFSYAMKVGVIGSVLLGLSAAKNFNDKRVEFFREAGSGYNVNAFFLSVHLTTLLEQVIMVILTGVVGLWLRNSFNNGFVFILNFIMMDWVVVAWGLLFPLFIPPENVIIVTGCFMAYCGIQFSGQLAPVNFKGVYTMCFNCSIFFKTIFRSN